MLRSHPGQPHHITPHPSHTLRVETWIWTVNTRSKGHTPTVQQPTLTGEIAVSAPRNTPRHHLILHFCIIHSTQHLFLQTVIPSISLWALHLNKHASFLLRDRLLLMKNDQTVSLYHPATSACLQQSRAINLPKRAFVSTDPAERTGAIRLSPLRRGREWKRITETPGC